MIVDPDACRLVDHPAHSASQTEETPMTVAFDNGVRPNTAQVDRAALPGASIAIAALLVFGLAGCAAEWGGTLSRSASAEAPYVGVFTGEYVDGKPLYRFPPVYVVGSRSSVPGDSIP